MFITKQELKITMLSTLAVVALGLFMHGVGRLAPETEVKPGETISGDLALPFEEPHSCVQTYWNAAVTLCAIEAPGDTSAQRACVHEILHKDAFGDLVDACAIERLVGEGEVI